MLARKLLLFCISLISLNNFAQILDIGDTLSINSLNYGLVGYYPFTGNAGDSSGTGNHGTEKNSVALTTDRFGNPNSAYLFDGSDDYIEIPDDNSLDLKDSFSILVWMNQYNAVAGGYRLVDKTTVGVNDGYNFDTYGSGGGRKLRLVAGSANIETNVSFSLNSWNQVLAIHRGDSSFLYQNSSLIATGAQTSVVTNSHPVRIGSNQNGGNYFNGKIDDIRLYNRALCDLEIKVVYGLVLTLNTSYKPAVCKNTSTNIKVVNPQPYIKYSLHKTSDSTQVGSIQSSPCSDTLYLSSGNLSQNSSFLVKATDPTNSQTKFLDTIITINVTQDDTTTIDTFLCNNISVFFDGQLRTDTGKYVGNFKSIAGCDSIVTLHIIKTGVEIFNQFHTICNGDSILLAGKYRKLAGNYYDTFARTGNCDSVINHQLSLLNPTSSYLFRNICFGDSVMVNTKFYKNQGIYYDTLNNSLGCDSILTIEVQYNSLDTATKNITICSNDSLKISSKFYKTSGTYTDTVYIGVCVDSLITINLSVVPSQFTSSVIDLCEGDSIFINSKNVGTSGVYYDSLKNKNGCDSIAQYNVTVHKNAVTVFTFRFCYTDSVFYGGNVYKTDTIFYDSLTTSFGCDSTVITVIDAGGVFPNLPDSAFFCDDKTTTIDAGDYKSYLWSDGSVGRFFTTTTSGSVWVILKDSFNCTFTDSTVFYEKCSPLVYVPTSFTPNGDGKNDFLIFNASNVDYIEFKVFDRWGEIVFETNNKNITWDGTYKDEALPIGLYHWVVRYKGTDYSGRTLIKNDSGELFILR